MYCSRRLIVQTLVFNRSYLHRQVSPPETLVVKGGTIWARNGRWILPENARLPRNIQVSFTCRKSTTWNRRLYFPSEGRRAEDFFALRNPTASVGFEPANLGTKGQHATSRPPKPLTGTLHEDLRTFMIIYLSLLLSMRNFSDRSCKENQNIRLMLFNSPPPKILPFMTYCGGIL